MKVKLNKGKNELRNERTIEQTNESTDKRSIEWMNETAVLRLLDSFAQ